MFKRLVNGKRCVVIADGFVCLLFPSFFRSASPTRRCSSYYEWKKLDKSGKKKQPFFFCAPPSVKAEGEIKQDPKLEDSKAPESERTPLTMAGLYDVWENRHTGELVYSYCVITVPAAKKAAEVHERMPAILNPDMIDLWMSPIVDIHEVLPLLKPFEDVHFYPVSPLVGNFKNDFPQCIQPLPSLKMDSGDTKLQLLSFKPEPKSQPSPTKGIGSFFSATKKRPPVKEELFPAVTCILDEEEDELTSLSGREGNPKKRKEQEHCDIDGDDDCIILSPPKSIKRE
jgi:putative SOS response-associated peptidase YedK